MVIMVMVFGFLLECFDIFFVYVSYVMGVMLLKLYVWVFEWLGLVLLGFGVLLVLVVMMCFYCNWVVIDCDSSEFYCSVCMEWLLFGLLIVMVVFFVIYVV